MGRNDSAFWLPRRCLREPIPEIADAQALLDEAANAHLSGKRARAAALIAAANIPIIRDWTESIWGRHNASVLRIRKVPDAPPIQPVALRPIPRHPNALLKRRLIGRDGYHCRFCGIPVIDSSIRVLLRTEYPDALCWGTKNFDQHAAFQCMWLQYDHVLPNGRGGESTFENMVVTCAPCNFGRMERTLEEVGLLAPQPPTPSPSKWDGLARLNRRVKGLESETN
ncbi:MAG: HNH endonuclease [Alphaproteobacteria bacterium]|jgi:5-methylcytosine-specific restriction endonuclease McrA|nr:HNH endonuclease [Alphaproteobacteria bacterium]